MNHLPEFRHKLPHSCYPNCAVNSAGELVVLRPANQGEPLTIDYSTLFAGGEEILSCRCGYNGCRGKILGFNAIPVRYQEFYLQHDAVSKAVLVTLENRIGQRQK